LANIGAAFAGSINKVRNGTLDIWQRGISITVPTSGAYTADGWIVVPTGASVSIAKGSPRLLTAASLTITGATGVTDALIRQRIEGLIAAPLSSQTVTVQAQVFNNTGTAITPTLVISPSRRGAAFPGS
jgi:hypothetical protein